MLPLHPDYNTSSQAQNSMFQYKSGKGRGSRQEAGTKLAPRQSRSLWANDEENLVRQDESEEVEAEVGEDVAHPPVGVHGAVDDLRWDPRQKQGGRQYRGLGLPFHLWERLKVR